MQWFEDWFNTPYYHILYKNRNEQEAAGFIDNLLNYLHLPKGTSCWDLNCGKGRHSLYLNQKGYKVIGTDLSEKSIAEAQTHQNENLQFFRHDMRGLFYANYFNAVFNLFTSFGYFKHGYEDEKVFQSVFHSLLPDGVFILDFFNAACVKTHLKCSENKTINNIEFSLHKRIERGFILKDIEITDQGKKYHFNESVRAYTLPDFEHLGKKAGFTIKATFGNYILEPFYQNASERLIIIFEKTA